MRFSRSLRFFACFWTYLSFDMAHMLWIFTVVKKRCDFKYLFSTSLQQTYNREQHPSEPKLHVNFVSFNVGTNFLWAVDVQQIWFNLLSYIVPLVQHFCNDSATMLTILFYLNLKFEWKIGKLECNKFERWDGANGVSLLQKGKRYEKIQRLLCIFIASVWGRKFNFERIWTKVISFSRVEMNFNLIK